MGTLGELIVHKSFGGGVLGNIDKRFKYSILLLLLFIYLFLYLFLDLILVAILQIHISSNTDEISDTSANQYQNQAHKSSVLNFLWPFCQLVPYFNALSRCLKLLSGENFQEVPLSAGLRVWICFQAALFEALLWISVHLHGSRKLGHGLGSTGGNPLVRKEHLSIYYFSYFFSAQNLRNNYDLLVFDGHFNAWWKYDKVLFSFHQILPGISADLQALLQTPQ